MNNYTKIPIVYKRSLEGKHHMIEGDYISDEVEYLANNKWVFTEKIDGMNTIVHWDGYRVEFGGRTEKTEIPKSLSEYLEKTFGTPEAEQVFEMLFGEKEVTMYGEGYGPKIQTGHTYRSDVSFILFDIKIGGMWLQRNALEDISKAFGINVVPVVIKGTIPEAVEFVKQHPKSNFGTAYMEGLVGKPEMEMFNRKHERIMIKVKYSDVSKMEVLI